jgi:hypothetical protein
VLGIVDGPVTALESIELRQTSKLIGNVVTSRILIEDGAYFKGSIDINRQTNRPLSGGQAAALEERYAKLVDLKYLRGLTKSEESEFESVSSKLAALDTSFYEPILERLGGSKDAWSKVEAPLRAS